MIKACIFDLDGTALDTIHAITHFVNLTFDLHGIPHVTEDECKIFVGNGARLLITRALASKGIMDSERVEKVLRDYNSLYDADPLALTAPFDGIPELFSALRQLGIRIAILSNKPESAVLPLVRHFFGESVDITRGGRENVPLKPDPASCHEILSQLGALPSETVYVGDTNTDMQTGKNLGAAVTVGVLWGFRGRDEIERAGADVIVSKPSQILGIVKEGLAQSAL